ncbi:MAG: HAMP domain-containing histidine kinase, partial [Planctomycetes bacterium]|nr:HAMP domain-containing histidine kinase [Planctomycetota bacterium]
TCIVIVARPEVWQAIVKGVTRSTFLVLLSGLFLMTVLMCLYIIQQERLIKRLRRELISHEQLKMLGNFVARISHDLNNRLAVAYGFADLLLQSDIPERAQRDARKIHTALEETKDFLHDLLAICRQHKIIQQKRVINLVDVIESLQDLLQNEFVNNKIAVKTDLPERILQVDGDYHQLSDVFLNLLKNAIDAMKGSPRKELNIRGEVRDDRCLICVSDTGHGIKDEVKDTLFEPFATTKPMGQGTGLGLSIARAAVAEHNGQISAQNNPDGGATFVVELPLLDENII